MPDGDKVFYDRRKGPDIWLKLITWISLIGWILIMAVLLIVSKAGPNLETFFDRLLEVRVQKGWDTELVEYAFYIMVVILLLGIIGLIINSKRHRRRDDRYRFTLIAMTVFSVIGIIIYILSF